MQRTAYFDCFSGASGDMILGALVDAGASIDDISKDLATLPVGPIQLRVERITRGGMRAAQLRVDVPHEHAHRGLPQIREIIGKSSLPQAVKDNALRIFSRLADAEALVHDQPVEKVHFHEVGALDAIADIVGSCCALHKLGINTVRFSELPLGGGTVKAAHGMLPVPAPATALLVKGLQCRMGPVEAELLTPTGAAILTTLGVQEAPASMRVDDIGYGAGTKEFAEIPNLLRVMIGAGEEAGTSDEVWVLEANVDDMTPQVCGHAIGRLIAAGALDAYAIPIQMKKTRPAWMLCAIVEESARAKVEQKFFSETTTFGVRRRRAQRTKLLREFVPVETPYGEIRMKVGTAGGSVVTAAPEFDDCRRAAHDHGAPLREVMAAAIRAFEARTPGTTAPGR